MDERELKFVVFLIHALSDYSGKSPASIYKVLNESGILDIYMLPCYHVLHTQGKLYLIEDITEFLKEKGYTIC